MIDENKLIEEFEKTIFTDQNQKKQYGDLLNYLIDNVPKVEKCGDCSRRSIAKECGVMNELMYRVCEVNGEECTFHCWEHYSTVVEASLLVGGHPAGQIAQVFGIVEFKDGTIERVQPYQIKFIPDELLLKRKKVDE